MTPSERALLLAVAKHVSAPTWTHQQFLPLITAVEAEAASEAPAEVKSCETCRFNINICGYSTYIPGCGWQPRTTEADVCPTCDGSGEVEANQAAGFGMTECPVCEGTGKKEKK